MTVAQTAEDFIRDRMTLATVREDLFSNLKDGAECPCCGQYVKRYRRTMSSTRAVGLIYLVREFLKTKDWVYIPDLFPRWILKSGGEFSVASHWDLAVNRPNTDTTKRTSGFWKPTEKGIQFVHRQVRVSKALYIYNNVVLFKDEESIWIDEVLEKKFDYAELMA